jgi:hypothetical protein
MTRCPVWRIFAILLGIKAENELSHIIHKEQYFTKKLSFCLRRISRIDSFSAFI